jgi:amino acid adenylation domain-containing protein
MNGSHPIPGRHFDADDQAPRAGAAARPTATDEPLAIVGIGCRLPGGADDWAAFWRLLDEGRDAVGETPEDRWSSAKFYLPGRPRPGKTQSRWGGHVAGLDAFDPQCFGIAPREAAGMDPQQRMLLEVALRAIEDAGIPTRRLAGGSVGVYVGISSFDHAVATLSYQDRGVLDAYSNTGGSSSIAANRISYCFDLRGPSVAVDTACSSSLVAVHLACEAIRRGEARMALAGGVNALLMPDFTVAFSQLGVLSPDGRCKTFDARANGYVRAEGAGMVLIKPLADAIRDGDLVYAVIRATALNQDGRTPGLTVPSGAAQEALVRAACHRAGIDPAAIQYVEAHGTGTPVGDPIEANALGAALGKGRAADQPCWIGSVKTNIGHLEAAAGIASLIKVSLALHHRRIPAHLHLREPNPAIDFAALGLRVPTASIDWPGGPPRLAGINGFGYGGANAHVLLEEAPAAAPPTPRIVAAARVLVPFAARSRRSLAAHAAALADWVAATDATLPEIAAYLAHRHAGGDARAAIVAGDRADLAARLRGLADAAADPTAAREPSLAARDVAFVFSGQGPQWWGMARVLLAENEVFRRVIDRCDAEFARHGDWSLRAELGRDEATSRMKHTRIAQPAIFAVQAGLAAVWESWGVVPGHCVGHSVGEIAAAHAAGGLSFEDACLVAFHRGRTMDLASSQGGMIAVGLAREDLGPWLAGCADEVAVAAVNGPTSLTLSGPAGTIAALAARLEEAGVFCRRLAVEYAFHSPLMDPVRDALRAALAEIRPRATSVPLVSTVTGGPVDGRLLDADYWWRNVRQAVLFADAMGTLAAAGAHVAVEVGPHPVLSYAIHECFQAAGRPVETLASLHRDRHDLECLLGSLGRLHELGLAIDWSRLFPRPHRRLPLPPEPFQKQVMLVESREARESRQAVAQHPLLGERGDGPTPRWQGRVDLRLQSYLRDHVVRGACIHPAAAVVEAAIAAARWLAPPEAATVRLERLELQGACIHAEESPQWMDCHYQPDRRRLIFSRRDADGDDWSRVAAVTVAADDDTALPPPEPPESLRRVGESFDRDRLYAYCRRLGLAYGPQFQTLVSGVRRDGECLGVVELAADLAADAEGHFLHPALLDGCFHAMIAADAAFDHAVPGLFLPHEIREIRFHGRPGRRATVHARIVSRIGDTMEADLDVFDADGRPCLAIRGFVSRRVAGTEPVAPANDLVYRFDWEAQELPASEAAPATGRWLLFADDAGFGDRLAAAFGARGCPTTLVRRGPGFEARDDGSFVIDADDRDHFARVLAALPAGGLAGVAYLWALDAPGTDGLTAEALESSTLLTCRAPVHLVQAWERASGTAATPCGFVTSAAQPPPGAAAPLAVAQAPLVGMARVVASEYGRLRARQIDLPGDPAAAVGRVVAELLGGSAEDEVLLRADGRWVRRFRPLRELDASPCAVAALPSRLEATDTSGIEDLRHRLFSPPALAAGEVEIEVRAAGLNFSDVMKALGLYPGLPPGPVLLGSECSGVITRVGPGVTEWRPGDDVMAVAPGSFGTHVTVAAALVARKPRTLSHEQAAAVPIAFLTAHHALHECGRIRAGESLLVHAASGGVGLAALQLARAAGGRILATAGSAEKRELVRRHGAEHVMDSRSLAFADELRRILPAGVDLILNSLPGEAIPRGIAALAIGGRFLEIGKRDIYADAPLGLHALRNNAAFFAIDLDQLFKRQPERMGLALRSLVERFESAAVEPLPVTVHAADDIGGAFRSMQQARHVGKVVVSYAERPRRSRPPAAAAPALDPRGTYWVAGGLGGFGLEIARWLAARGAGTLVLGGRGGNLSTAAAAAIAALERGGTTVHVVPADITRPAEVRRVLRLIADTMPPLRGIFHTAMVLEDRLLLDLDRGTLDRVLRPKVLGGWNLHNESAGIDLDHFVLFSSLSSVFGHAGQANYAAANAALDGLAHHRRGLGLPATVVNWGHVGEVGYLAERQELSARLERQGVLPFTVREATECLATALVSREPQLSVLRMEWSLWRGLGITDNVPPKFAHLLRKRSGAAGPVAASPEAIRAAAPTDRRPLVERLVRDKAAALLGADAADMDDHRPLLELGLDSLMAVELRNWIENQLGVGLPIATLMRGAGVAALADSICAGIEAAPTAEPAPQTVTTAGGVATEFPMSAGQRGLWYAYRRDPQSTPYNVFLPSRLRSPLDIDALRRTIETVVERHPALRTTFADDGGMLRQRIHAALLPEFVVHDAAGADLDTLRETMVADAARPFDLEHGPLVRMAVYRLADDDWLVLATTHHIVVDFWSLIIILDEVGRIYPRLAAGDAADLPPAVGNYADFVQRQESLLAGDRGAALARHWRETLRGMPTVLELPTDRVRPRSFTGRADTVAIAAPADTVAAIARLAAAERVTPSAVVLAAVQVLMARYSGRDAFLIGMPFSGRGQQRFENTVGFFVNMLPLPARLDDASSFAALLRRAGASLVDGLEHEDYPLAAIVQDLAPARDPSRSPLFQVSCTFEKAQLRDERGRAGFLFPDRAEVAVVGGMRQETFPVPQRTCLYDVEFVFEMTDDSLRGMICFCRDLFATDTMRAMAANFVALLDALVAAPHVPVERVGWPAAGLPPPAPAAHGPTTVAEALRPALASHASRPAIVDGDASWDYGRLAADCGRIAAELAAAGVARGELVPVVGTGAAAVVGTVATILAGAAAVPIDPRRPAAGCAEVLDDTAARVAVDAGASAWLDAAAGLARIDVAAARAPAPPVAPVAIGPADLAYCIYTSGSTGRPKGVLVEHAAIANTLAWRREAVPLAADDRVLLPFSPQFDAAVGIVLTTLAQGATLVLASDPTDVDALVDQIIRERITVLPAVPALLQLVAAHPRFAACVTLRQIWSGGESLPPELPALVARLRGVKLWNFYGPTEAAVEAAAWPVEAVDATRPVPIGRPVAGTRLIVLDAAGRPVPDTVPGELAIVGPGLARGYLRRPELTAARFVTLGPECGGLRAYLTGDRCRRRADGTLEFLGRLDDQVKLRGYRLELGEIESCLRMHPAVSAAAAKVVGDQAQARLACFVVPRPAAAPGDDAARARLAAELRGWAAERLAAYKVPAAVALVADLPLTAGGKIDRGRLPDAVPADACRDGLVPPSTALERQLAELWQETLDLERVGVHQNFFDLGGTSLQAALLTARLGERLGVHVPTALLFDLADIAQIARRLVQLHPAEMEARFGRESVAAYDGAVAEAAPGGGPHPLLVPLKPAGDLAPLFLVHPPGGIVACYRDLARAVAAGRPLYGVRARGIHGRERLPETLEEMAAEYVAAIRSRQPTGPYLLGGWSLGGVVAAEVARQILAAGESVERLLLIDSALPEAAHPVAANGRAFHAGMEYGLDVDLETLARMSPEEQLPFLWQHARRLGIVDEQAPEELANRILADLRMLFAHHVSLCETYRPQWSPIDVLLFRPSEVPFRTDEPEDRGWGHFARSVEVRIVPGHHHSMVAQPHATALAAAIDESLADVAAAAGA